MKAVLVVQIELLGCCHSNAIKSMSYYYQLSWTKKKRGRRRLTGTHSLPMRR
jgi:hypothetical protein